MDVPFLGRPLGWICLDCRLALDEGQPCPEDPGHIRASVDDDAGRRRLLGRVWSGGTVPPTAILEALLRRFELPWLAPPLGGAPPSTGMGRAAASGLAEGLAQPLARSLVFLFEDSGHRAVLLRDSRTTGFRIAQRGGQTILVRPGPIRLAGFSDRTQVSARDPETRALLPFNVVMRSLLLPGDAVTLHSPVDEELDRSEPTGLYRDRPPTLVVARAPAVLRVGGVGRMLAG